MLNLNKRMAHMNTQRDVIYAKNNDYEHMQ
jgi:hypothetical protein